jgi:hypothetical protein
VFLIAWLAALVVGLTLIPAVWPAASAQPAVDAKIQIVWPHMRRETTFTGFEMRFPLANVEVYLFERGTLNPVACDFANRVVLRWAVNWSTSQVPSHHSFSWWFAHAMPEGVEGERILRTVDGKTFPVWVFNDVPTRVDPEQLDAGWEREKQFFFVEVEGLDVRSNVWAHAFDGRTLAPSPLMPQEVAPASGNVLDAIIQIVWPHDREGNERPVDEAELVNVAVDLFHHPFDAVVDRRQVSKALGFGFDRPVVLLRSLNHGLLEPVKRADQVIAVTRQLFEGGPMISWPRWVFNDVEVSAARDPANKYYFTVRVDGLATHTTVWAHGADARTYFPQRDVPARGC